MFVYAYRVFEHPAFEGRSSKLLTDAMNENWVTILDGLENITRRKGNTRNCKLEYVRKNFSENSDRFYKQLAINALLNHKNNTRWSIEIVMRLLYVRMVKLLTHNGNSLRLLSRNVPNGTAGGCPSSFACNRPTGSSFTLICLYAWSVSARITLSEYGSPRNWMC